MSALAGSSGQPRTVPKRILLQHLLASTLCIGLAFANLTRVGAPALAVCALVLLLASGRVEGTARVALLVAALALAGWWWGSVRLAALDHSVLEARVDTAERSLVEVTAPPRVARFRIRAKARVLRFGPLDVRENVLLELPPGRVPPQGAVLSLVATVRLPRGPEHGFDERTWLRRNGIHVVLRADRWQFVRQRGGLGGLSDRLHAWLARSSAHGLHGEQRAVLEGVVLGETQGLGDSTLERFRASGLYHVLAVDGLKVAAVAAGAGGLAFLLGAGRFAAELLALLAVGGYVLAVGERPSVLRAAIAAGLVSLAWLTARQRDSWQALLVAAVAVLAWNPYFVADAGFQLSFAAVASIFVIAPRVTRRLEGYPVHEAWRS